MACHHTCVDIGKPYSYSVRRSSCTDCGKVGECDYFVAQKFVCPCDDKKPPIPSNCGPCAAGNFAAKANSEKQASPVQIPTNSSGSGKQTFWQWLLSLIGLGKKNEVNKQTDDNKKDLTSELSPDVRIKQEQDAALKAKDATELLNKPEKAEEKQPNLASPPAPAKDDSPDSKAKDLTPGDKKVKRTRKRRRSQSADSKSRNKYLGRPLEPSPPVKRRTSPAQVANSTIRATSKTPSEPASPAAADSGTAKTTAIRTITLTHHESPTFKPQKVSEPSPQATRPPISPVYSSKKHLKPYQSSSWQGAKVSSSPKQREKSPTSTPKKEVSTAAAAVKNDGHKCPSCTEPFEKSFAATMSCPAPCCISPCACTMSPVICCSPKPCCNPSITTLMRQRCPSPSKVCKKRSKSCASPRCVNECAAMFRKEMKPRRRQNNCQVCCICPSGKCCRCTPMTCKENPPSPCPPKCPCSQPKQPECCTTPKLCSNICQPPSNLKPLLPPTSSSYGKCPITCMRPCCVPIPVTPFNNCCPSIKPKCPSGGCSPTTPKTHTAATLPKPPTKAPFPPFCSTYCSPTSLKSYARSKDGDAYCKFLMSRYNVSVPDYPPLLPMTLSGCSPIRQASHVAPEYRRSSNECSDKCTSLATSNATGNYTETSNECPSCHHKEQQNDPVVYNASPSKKQPVSAFRLPKRTPVECIREQGPRSPVREYSSKLGLPNKPPRQQSTSPQAEPSTAETGQEQGEQSPAGQKQKGKSPKKKKLQIASEEQIPEESAELLEEIEGENKSENKTTSDSGTMINNNSHVNQSDLPGGESPRVHRVKYTRRVSNKRSCPIKEYTTSAPNERLNNCNSSFYRNFLDVSPRVYLTRKASDMKFKEVHDHLNQSPNFNNKRASMAASPYHRSRSISPLPISKISVPCHVSPNKSRARKESPVTSFNTYLQRNQYSATKAPSPGRGDNVSLLYKERSFFIESNNTQAGSSRRARKSPSPQMARLAKQADRGYQDLYIQSAERAYNQLAQKPPNYKGESPKSPTFACFFYDEETMKPFLNDKIPIEIKRSPKKSRSAASPHEKRRELISKHDTYEKEYSKEGGSLQSRSPTNKMKALSTEMNALRDEIVALLNDSQEDLPDEDSLKTDTTECLTDGFGPEISVSVEPPRIEKQVSELAMLDTEAPIITPAGKVGASVKLVSPIRERDGSSSVDGVYLILPTIHQTEPCRSVELCESSVDPREYESFGESCVDPANFHSTGSLECCYFHTNSGAPDYSNNHYGTGAHTSTSVDTGAVRSSRNNFSNNYNTGSDTSNTHVDGGDVEDKSSKVPNTQQTPSIPESTQIDTPKSEISSNSPDASIRTILNKLRNDLCSDYHGIGRYKSSSVDGNVFEDDSSYLGSAVDGINCVHASNEFTKPDPEVVTNAEDIAKHSMNNSNNYVENVETVGACSEEVDSGEGGGSVCESSDLVDVDEGVSADTVMSCQAGTCDAGESQSENDDQLNTASSTAMPSRDNDNILVTDMNGKPNIQINSAAAAHEVSNVLITKCHEPTVNGDDGEITQSVKEPNVCEDSTPNPTETKPPSLLQELLGNSGVKWQQVGPATATDIRIMRIAKAAVMATSHDKADDLPYLNMFKSENESLSHLSSGLLKPEGPDGEEQSILSRIKDL